MSKPKNLTKQFLFIEFLSQLLFAGMTRELGVDVEIRSFEFQTQYLVGGMLAGLSSVNEITL